MFFTNIVEHTHKLISYASTRTSSDMPVTIVLGLSGGPDSVFLFHVLEHLHRSTAIKLVVAHLDHGWRTTSANDAVFCLQLCLRHAVPCFVATPDETIANNNGSLEDFGRRLRRAHFKKIADACNASFIALAHHLDDQEETFVMRLMRGSTLAGLSCMREVDGMYLRPLLSIPKKDIAHYLDKQKIQYCIDPTNGSDDFLRNRIRNHVIPALRLCDQRFDQKFKTTLSTLTAEDTFLQNLTEQKFSELFTYDDTLKTACAKRTELLALDRVLAQRVVLHWLIHQGVAFTPSASLINEIMRFLETPNGASHRIAANALLHKQRGLIWIERQQQEPHTAV
jgi:tRNA(Ile)-lysidine synthetase-like protein